MAKVLILYTGGTFGMIERKRGSGRAESRIPKLSGPALRRRMLKYLPDLPALAKCDVEVVFNRDSSHLGPEDWIELARRIRAKWNNYDGIVLLHGTDTLAYGASALSFLLHPCKKPVILTGAQKPLATLRTDARRNLVSAVEIAAHGPRSLVSQVCVFFDDRLLQGNRVRKRSAVEFEAFESPKSAPLAIVGASIRYSKDKPASSKASRSPIPARFDRSVTMLHLTPGFPAAAVAQGLLPKINGLVLVAFPSATGPTHDLEFIDLLRLARRRGVPVVLVTEGVSQVPTGSGVDPRNYEAGQKMLKEGALWAGEMTPECAFIKLSMILGQVGVQVRGRKNRERAIKRLWAQNWAFEG